jgi:shikimate dehydrogenase
MKTFGLIGKSLSHSFSQQYFAEKFLQNNVHDTEYLPFSLDNIQEVKELFKHPSLFGFNVTIPYKTEIIPFLDDLDPVVQEIGAVNCVVKQNNRWVGYNTDVVGFEETLQQVENGRSGNSAIILGTGGASKAVSYVLSQKKIPFQLISRKKTEKTITYNEVTDELIHQSTFIINTTPLGMFPNINEKPPIPYSALNSNHILIDLIYNPEETLFLKEGNKCGAFVINGLEMLKAQAEESWKLFKRSHPNTF